jgi:hypothetical protein
VRCTITIFTQYFAWFRRMCTRENFCRYELGKGRIGKVLFSIPYKPKMIARFID